MPKPPKIILRDATNRTSQPIFDLTRTTSRFDDVLHRGPCAPSLSSEVGHNRLRAILPTRLTALAPRLMPYSKDATAIYYALRIYEEWQIEDRLRCLILAAIQKFALRRSASIKDFWIALPGVVDFCHELSAVTVRDLVLSLALRARATGSGLGMHLSDLYQLFRSEAEGWDDVDEVTWMSGVRAKAIVEEQTAWQLTKQGKAEPDPPYKNLPIEIPRRVEAQARGEGEGERSSKRRRFNTPCIEVRWMSRKEPRNGDSSRRLLYIRSDDAKWNEKFPIPDQPVSDLGLEQPAEQIGGFKASPSSVNTSPIPSVAAAIVSKQTTAPAASAEAHKTRRSLPIGKGRIQLRKTR